jgi:phosphoglycolate phosphatase
VPTLTLTLSRVTIRTIIFDLDGTISDPLVGIFASINYALEAYGYDRVDVGDVRPLIGPPLTEIFEHLIGKVPESRMLELVHKYRERYASVGYTENKIYAQITETIATLSSSGYELGVCTSKPAYYATKIIEMFQLHEHFSFVDGGDIGVHKVDQLSRLVTNGLQPDAAIMIGDREVDINAAKGNGIASVGVLWGFGSRKELQLAQPDHLLELPAELLTLFG